MDKFGWIHFLGDQYKGGEHKRVKMQSQQNLIPISRYLSLTFPASQPNKKGKSRSRSLQKFSLFAPFFGSHPEYHHKKWPNPAFRQTYCGPSIHRRTIFISTSTMCHEYECRGFNLHDIICCEVMMHSSCSRQSYKAKIIPSKSALRYIQLYQ